MVLSPAEKTTGGSGGRWSAAKPFLRAPAARRTGRGSCAHRSSGWLGSDNQSWWEKCCFCIQNHHVWVKSGGFCVVLVEILPWRGCAAAWGDGAQTEGVFVGVFFVFW